MPSLFKYFREQDPDIHGSGQLLNWPGAPNGLPVRTPKGEPLPLLKQHEQDELFGTVGDFKHRVFKLWEPEDDRLYDYVQDRIKNGWFRECRRYDVWKDEHDNMLVYLEWVQLYAVAENLGGKDAAFQPPH